MHDQSFAELIARVRSHIVPDKHPQTAAALDQLVIAVKSWADQSARFVLKCMLFCVLDLSVFY